MLRDNASPEGILQWKLMPAKKKLAVQEAIDRMVCGSVYESLCIASGGEEPCATKVMQYQFGAFAIEVGVYERWKESAMCLHSTARSPECGSRVPLEWS
jgi:hypothetical protein